MRNDLVFTEEDVLRTWEPFVNGFLHALHILELLSSVYIVLAGVWDLGLYRKQQRLESRYTDSPMRRLFSKMLNIGVVISLYKMYSVCFSVVFFLLGDSPPSEFYVPTLRNTVPSS